jgi:hypothetical protein
MLPRGNLHGAQGGSCGERGGGREIFFEQDMWIFELELIVMYTLNIKELMS